MCQAVLSPNLTKKFQWEVSQIAHNRFPCVTLLGGLSVNLNHLKMDKNNQKVHFSSLVRLTSVFLFHFLSFYNFLEMFHQNSKFKKIGLTQIIPSHHYITHKLPFGHFFKKALKTLFLSFFIQLFVACKLALGCVEQFPI